MKHAGVEEIVTTLDALGSNGNGLLLVAIAGRGGAGKTTLASAIAARVDGTQIVHGDDFAGPDYLVAARERLRAQVLEPLRAGKRARYQRWDWDTKRLAEWRSVEPRGVVIVEGVAVTALDLGDSWDLAIWVDTPTEIRIARGVERDGEHMRSTWLDVWEPQEDAYVAEQRPDERADVIVRGDEPY